MGIVNPRPAMRAGEARRILSSLQRHALLMELMQPELSKPDASKIAYMLIRTSGMRAVVWNRK